MKTKIGDLIEECTSGIILHQVNCQGVMGKGIALQIKNKYPSVYAKYKEVCSQNEGLSSSSMLGAVVPVKVSPELIVLNVFGQDYYANNHGETKRYTSYDALDNAFVRIKEWIKRHNFSLDMIQHPMIGCSLAGAEWQVVEAMLNLHFNSQSTLWILPEKKGIK